MAGLSRNVTTKCIDYGQNFLTGKATSVLSSNGIDIQATNFKEIVDAIQNKTMDSVSYLQNTITNETSYIATQIGASAGSVVGAGLSSMQATFQSAELAKMMAEELAKYGVEKIGKLTTDVMSKTIAFPKEVADKAKTKAVNMAKEELADALKLVMGSPAEAKAEESAQKQKEKKQNKTIEWCKKAIKDANEFKDKTLTSFKKDMKDVSALMIQGPEWVSSQLDTIEKQGKTTIDEQAKDMQKKVNDFYSNAVEDSANALASQIKSKLIDPTISKAKDLYNETGTTTNQTKQKAKAAIQKKLFSLAGKLGIPPI